MRWNSLDELVKDLKLEVDPSDEASVKSQIRKELFAIHPDKNNGQFSSETERKRFEELTRALDFLEDGNQGSQALTLLSTRSAIIQAISDVLAPTQEETLSRKQDECRIAYKTATKSRYFFPRLKSGLLAGICGLLITFAGQLKTHPLFSPLLTIGHSRSIYFEQLFEYEKERQSAQGVIRVDFNETYKAALAKYAEQRLSWLLIILSTLFIYFGILFLITWLDERRDEEKAEWLMSEEGLRYILRQVLQKKSSPTEGTGRVYFTKHDLESEIKELYRRKRRLRIPFRSYAGLSSSIAEKLAKLHLEELSNRGIIKRTEGTKLNIIYEVEEKISSELKEEPSEAKA